MKCDRGQEELTKEKEEDAGVAKTPGLTVGLTFHQPQIDSDSNPHYSLAYGHLIPQTCPEPTVDENSP